jgi:hypothetical protein
MRGGAPTRPYMRFEPVDGRGARMLERSLVMLKPVAQALDDTGPLAEATASGLGTFISAPLHGGELPTMVTGELARLIDPGVTPAEAALRVSASTPGVKHIPPPPAFPTAAS